MLRVCDAWLWCWTVWSQIGGVSGNVASSRGRTTAAMNIRKSEDLIAWRGESCFLSAVIMMFAKMMGMSVCADEGTPTKPLRAPGEFKERSCECCHCTVALC